MRLIWLPVNQRWYLLFGEQIITLHGEDRSFATRQEAKAAAARRGLRVNKNLTVEVEKADGTYN